MSNPPPTLEQTVRVLQIITGALVAGAVVFAGIVVLGIGALDQQQQGVIISGLAAVYAVAAFVMHLVVPLLVANRKVCTAEGNEFNEIYQQKTIIGLSLLEGAAFFNLLVIMIEHNWWSLVIAGGLVFWMLAMFPTRTRVEQWVETQQMLRQTES